MALVGLGLGLGLGQRWQVAKPEIFPSAFQFGPRQVVVRDHLPGYCQADGGHLRVNQGRSLVNAKIDAKQHHLP